MKSDKGLSITSPNNYLLLQEYADHRKVLINNILFALPLQSRYSPIFIMCHLLKCACLQALWKSLIRAEIGGRLCSKYLEVPFRTDVGFQQSWTRALAIRQQFICCALLELCGSGHARNAKSCSCVLPFGFIIYFTLFYLNASEKALFKTSPSLLAFSRSLLRGTVSLI